MKWKKLGLLFVPEKQHPWMVSHATLPIAQHINRDIFRIYFSCRNSSQQSNVGYIELDIRSPKEILNISPHPVLSPGNPGLYDDSGTSLACILPIQSKLYGFYVGWNLSVTVPWRNSIGLGIYDAEENYFSKPFFAPILDRSHIDPFSLSYPWIITENNLFKMWYGSNLNWGAQKNEMQHVIKYAESQDGIHWERKNNICINFNDPEEYAICRPCVIKDSDCYRMWYSYRGERYRIGYAESQDGLTWVRKDGKVGIDVSSTGWDSEMIEYPFIFDHQGERYMLYNGNDYGRSGIGLAILESSN